MNSEKNPNKIRSALEDQAFDALLSEAIGGPSAPDLSAAILERLNSPSPAQSQIVSAIETRGPGTTPGANVRSAAKRRRGLPGTAVAISVLAAVAAGLLIAFVIRQEPAEYRFDREAQNDLANNDHRSPTRPAPQRESTPDVGPGVTVDPSSIAVEPRRQGIPLVEDSGLDLDDRGIGAAPHELVPRVADAPPTQPRSTAFERQPIRLVSQRVNADLHAYWDALGVTPAESRGRRATLDAVTSRLGIKLTVAALDSAEAMREQLVQPGNPRQLAEKWLDQVTEGGLARLEPAQRDLLLQPLSACFRGDRPFDDVLTSWISEPGEQSTAWFKAIGGPSHRGLQRLGRLTMNADLRCSQCHDSLPVTGDQQQDYWAFAALVRGEVKREPDQPWQVVLHEDDSPSKPLYYDLLDERRKLAEPGVSADWLPQADGQSPASLQAWTNQLQGSEALARGVVNSLWQLVHGRPLRGSAVDPLFAPTDPQLVELEQELVVDLLAHEFDLSRTLSLIITSPATDRDVPETLVGDFEFAGDNAALRAAAGAFAVATPQPSDLPVWRRMAIAMRSIGARVDGQDPTGALLAQPAPGAASQAGPSSTPASKDPPADYPVQAEGLPVAWLADVQGIEAKVQHLCYLKGRNSVPDQIAEATAAMQKAELPEPLLLQRVWWLLQE